MPYCRALRPPIWLSLLVVVYGCSREELGRDRPEASRAISREVEAACEMADEIAARTPGVSIQRERGVFSDEALHEPVLGCRLVISGSFAQAATVGATPADGLAEGFAAQKWQEMTEYAADGKDGTGFAFRRADVACYVRGEWDGGSDDQPEIPREDSYKVTVLCASPVPAGTRQP